METSVNNKCRAFTSLEQSKKLAEILPLESADMYYEPSTGYCTEPSEVRFGDIKYAHPRSIRCWSLASLLELLPKRLEIADNVYLLSVYFYGLYYWNINNGNLCFESKDKDNLVDACVDMIKKLHELNLL